MTDGKTPQAAAFIVDDNLRVPATYAEASSVWICGNSGQYVTSWRTCILEAFFVSWRSCPCQLGRRSLGTEGLFSPQYNADRRVVKGRVRLVAKGSSQVLEEDFDETYAAVARLGCFQIVMVVATQTRLKTWQVNFVSVYLNSLCEYEVRICANARGRNLPTVAGQGRMLLHACLGQGSDARLVQRALRRLRSTRLIRVKSRRMRSITHRWRVHAHQHPFR